MTDWADLGRELDAWGRAAKSATLWWRDDDAVTSTPALHRLLETTAARLPLALAVIPAQADSTLPQVLSTASHVVALQHGYAHANQAPASSKKAEFGAGRDSSAALRELLEGSRRMGELFGDHALPVLVPPWNRIDPMLSGRLGELGIRGLSTYGPRAAASMKDGLIVVNTHIDIIDWRGGRQFLGLERCLQLAISHLAARREGRVDPNEATGLLTHHLVHDADAWSFLAAFLRYTTGHAAARWMDARQLFSCSVEGPA